MAFYAGKDGSVTVGAATWKLSEWTLDIETDILDTTNFESGGKRENIEGLTKATITGKGPYDAGAMALTSGASVEWVLTVGGLITFTVTARTGKMKVSTNVEGKAELEVNAESNGTFTAAIT